MNAPTGRFGEALETYYGLYAGVVEDNKDPEDRGRVRVKLEWISADFTTDWANVAQIYAGDGYGAYWIPEIEDQVIVAFMRGQLRQPIVLGSIYSQLATPKLVRSSSSDPKYFRTKGGHMLLMEDGTGRKVELIDATGDNSVVIDSEANSITVKSGGNVTVEAGGSLVLKGKDITIKASTTVTVSGTTINLN
ncbi:MAG TPA: phage baseplate assembly protein V [Allosphingosinicella sp.]|nr:phage baseplate assembly protein V [Allosphingosinicella sp.]